MTRKTMKGTARPSRTIVHVLPTCKISGAKLFHYTPTSNLDSIARGGLKPHISDFMKTHAAPIYEHASRPIVWAANREEMFDDLIDSLERRNKPDGFYSIIGITTAGVKRYFKRIGPGDYYSYSTSTVPPEYLCIIDSHEYAKSRLKATELKPEVPSLDLLRDPTFRNRVNSFAIRYHEATGSGGKHFDYALGSKTGKHVIDFVIPKKVPAELAAKKGNLPLPGKPNRQVILMPAHDQAYLTARTGKIHVIPEVKYGAGKWRIVVKGKAYVKIYPKGFIIGLKPTGQQEFTEYKLYQHEIKGKQGWFIIHSNRPAVMEKRGAAT